MEQILAAATNDAGNHALLVASGIEGLSAEPGEQSDASGS